MEKEYSNQDLIKQLTDYTINHLKERCFDEPADWFNFHRLDSLPPNEVLEMIYEEKNEIEADFYHKLNEEVRKERIKVINELGDISLLINSDSGNNPLHVINDESLVDLLIEKGFNVNENNKRMCNPLEERLYDEYGFPKHILRDIKETENERRMILKLIDSGVDYSRVIKDLPNEVRRYIKIKEERDIMDNVFKEIPEQST
ncbi:ankyrin repeat domain-containing protein, partial [Salmonella enterica subsp. enterica serovar Newport]|nr:ankyrin repeat domain-containing protein [Salmonella enterica subsp. enterica serovar Newport]